MVASALRQTLPCAILTFSRRHAEAPVVTAILLICTHQRLVNDIDVDEVILRDGDLITIGPSVPGELMIDLIPLQDVFLLGVLLPVFLFSVMRA